MKPTQLKAVKLTKRIFRNLQIHEGQTEKEVADRIKSQLSRFGAHPAFRIIVASGKRSAKPHGFATNKKIGKGELVVVDFGALYKGYRSDITRTFVTGKPTPRQRKILGIVREAQKRAIRAVRAGKEGQEVDKAARDYITQKGFGKYFLHSTGHGIGKKVHEAPKLSRKNQHLLKAGQVITVEPGIYIKGWGGVRFEDMLEVTKTGGKILTL